MDRFFKQLTALTEEEPTMKKAVDNIFKDCQTEDQIHGNIKTPVVEAIAKICRGHREDETAHLDGTIRGHQAINKPGFYQPVPAPEDESLRRVTSLSSFVTYHMLESFRGKNRLGMGFDAHGTIEKFKRDLLDRFEHDQVELEMDELQGSCGPPARPTWWTFYEENRHVPGSGEAYMQELALSEQEMNRAEVDNTTLELAIEPGALGQDLFKPTALDAFGPETRFEPELTGKPYGYTSPPKAGLQARPELVSPPVGYRELATDTILIIRRLPYRILQ
jgi:hypothetical protein